MSQYFNKINLDENFKLKENQLQILNLTRKGEKNVQM